MKTIFICGSGSINKKQIKKHINEIDYIIAADGGYDNLFNIGLQPNIILGDMDSIKKIPQHLKVNIFSKNKSKSDLELCLNHVKRNFKKVDKIIIDGALSENRIDHTISNLMQFTYSKINFMLFTPNSTVFFINQKNNYSFSSKKNAKVSIIQIKKGHLSGTGLKFKLPKTLRSYTHGISNETKSTEFNLTISGGKWIVIVFD